MKILVEKSNIEPVLRRLVGIVDKRQVIPILANVSIETGEGVITLRVSNLDMDAIDICPAAIATKGATTVDVHKLYDIVRGYPAGAQILLDLTTDDPRMVVSTGRSRFRLPVLPPTDFPAVNETDWQAVIELPASELAGALAKSAYAAGQDASRYIFTGVHMHSTETGLRTVATSGFRLALADITVETPGGISIIIPNKTVGEMQRRIADFEGDVTLSIRAGRLALRTGDAVVSSKLIDGEYPQYSRTIPQGDATVITVDADALNYAVSAASLVSAEKTPAMRISVENGAMIITGRGSDADAHDEIAVDYDGEQVEYMCSASAVADAVRALNADVVELEFRGPLVPMIIRKPSDPTTMAMVVPMRGG